ncbi:lytic transglycosylase domain-containing protein [Flavobacteriaceae bacterium]|nr:lytic transglycosylase domain-containing protein [Flavobacteriaceae bacterium]MDB3862610.1 lytic transglycosylase domain-containing protein [Flavobacteriaceae bacterium]
MHIHKTILISFIAIISLVSFKAFDLEKLTAFNSHGEDAYKVFALKLPLNLEFSGEVVPLDQPDIRERLDKELLVNTYWQSNMMLLLKRANKYFPTIEKILEEEGVPNDFKYLAVIESALENVRSPKGAKGFWQIMPNTAKEYGLEVNSNVDERYHIEKSTRVASAYLNKAKKRLGSWTLAAASYNRGMYGTDRLLEKQIADNYYDLLLNNETSRYVFRILAIKEIMSNPKRYGFIYDPEDLYQPIPVRKIGLDTAIRNIAMFAKEQSINYKILKIHNPWLIQNHLNNKSRKYYEIEIPETGNY